MDAFANYIKATAQEIKQVKWPTRQQAAFYTLLVLVVSGITALYAGAFDYVFSQIISYVINLY